MYLVSNLPNDQDIIEVAKKLCVTLQDDIKWENFGMSLLGTTSNEDMKLIQLECQATPPVTRYKRLLEVWKERTPKSECQWEKVVDVLNKMKFKRLAEEMLKVISNSRDDQLNSTSRDDQLNSTSMINPGTEAVSEGRSSSQPNEHSCIICDVHLIATQ